MSSSEEGRLLEAQEILVLKPIYSTYDISKASREAILGFQYFQGSVDAYCVECKAPSIFESEVELPTIHAGPVPFPPGTLERAIDYLGEDDAHGDRTFKIELSCTRNRDHRIWFFFLVRNDILMKVGQYPSIADFELPKLDRFKAVLNTSQRKELARAAGLRAHGVGIGSFVYLRRVFESLVEKAHRVACEQEDWDEERYENGRVDEKILLLRGYLPALLVKNASIYSILSAGIHQLDEDECLEYFTTVQLGIEMILEEESEKLQKQRQAKSLRDEIGRITGKIRGKS
jgi:hypothetical protein